jgi:hypothetical protein
VASAPRRCPPPPHRPHSREPQSATLNARHPPPGRRRLRHLRPPPLLPWSKTWTRGVVTRGHPSTGEAEPRLGEEGYRATGCRGQPPGAEDCVHSAALGDPRANPCRPHYRVCQVSSAAASGDGEEKEGGWGRQRRGLGFPSPRSPRGDDVRGYSGSSPHVVEQPRKNMRNSSKSRASYSKV